MAEILSGDGVPIRLHRHGIHDTYSLIGPPTHLYKHYQLDSDGIRNVITKQLKDLS